MSTIQIPPITGSTTSASFFADFIAMNKEENRNFSHRYLAQRLKWPMSYISDVMRERKTLSVARAVEFSKFAKLDSLDTEKLIFLALSENSKKEVKEFFVRKLTARTTASTDAGIRHHKQYAENFARYAEKPVFPALFTSGFVELPKEKFNELARKLLEVRNSLLEHAEESNKAAKMALGDSFVFQFDINLFLVQNKNLLSKIEKD